MHPRISRDSILLWSTVVLIVGMALLQNKQISLPLLIPPGNELLLRSQRCRISTGWMKGKDTTQSCAGCIVAAHSMYTTTWRC
jgi:hypothetical protein